jgi:hypothetical protein
MPEEEPWIILHIKSNKMKKIKFVPLLCLMLAGLVSFAQTDCLVLKKVYTFLLIVL